MTLQCITLFDNREIMIERRQRQQDGLNDTHAALADWAKTKFVLKKTPDKTVMSRIFNDPYLKLGENTSHTQFRTKTPEKLNWTKLFMHGSLKCVTRDRVSEVRLSKKRNHG